MSLAVLRQQKVKTKKASHKSRCQRRRTNGRERHVDQICETRRQIACRARDIGNVP